MKKESPNLSRHLFWDTPFDKIDWEKNYLMVIERVVERGNEQEWQEINRFYGEWKVRYTLLNEATFWLEGTMEKACNLLNSPKEHLYCFKHSERRHKKIELLASLQKR